MHRFFLVTNGTLLFLATLAGAGCTVDRGIFEGEANVGGAALRGSMTYAPDSDTYTVTGSGEDIYGERDEFYFVWRRMTGDLVLAADVTFEDTSGHMFKKAGWMIRAGLEDDDPFADALVHNDGLIALQYRAEKGGPTYEMSAGIRAPATLILERTGNLYSVFLMQGREDMRVVGNVTLMLPDEVYAGLAVCAHDVDALETAYFTNVSARSLDVPEERELESTLEVLHVGTGDRRIMRTARVHMEAPNWSPDGGSLVFNQGGRLYSIDLSSRILVSVETGFADRINNDHGFSPDGALMAISHNLEEEGSIIYTLPAEGGTPTRITDQGPSYWHGWSPDGEMLAYTARRNGEFDIYVIPASGGDEIRLTDAPGLDDGPDYSPDGRYIYFNSERSGAMKIWRMSADGTNPEQLTYGEETADWFPHPSPDGRWVVFLAYDGSVEGHPANKSVTLRIMPADGGTPLVIATLFGGQGTINVPSWAPDSQQLAFVSYRLVGPA